MGQITLKNTPKLRLFNLLRRRKMTLIQFMSEFGITTLEGLKNRCDRMGVDPPSDDEFNALVKPTIEKIVNNPQEGIVVLDPLLAIVNESTGKKTIDDKKVEYPSEQEFLDATEKLRVDDEETSSEPTDGPQKKSRKKKDAQPKE